jgi:hypothetical protein
MKGYGPEWDAAGEGSGWRKRTLTMPSTDWHWEQGIKFAVEGIKIAVLLNGAAAIALMTFENTHPFSNTMIIAVALFAFGALISALGYVSAYQGQVEYGNAELPGSDRDKAWEKGRSHNRLGLIAVLAGMVLFLFGAVTASIALSSAPPAADQGGSHSSV